MPKITTGVASFDNYNNDRTGVTCGRAQRSIHLPADREAMLEGRLGSLHAVRGLGAVPSFVWRACEKAHPGSPIVLHEFGNSRGCRLRWRVRGWIVASASGEALAAFASLIAKDGAVIRGVLESIFRSELEPKPCRIHRDVHVGRVPALDERLAERSAMLATRLATRLAERRGKDEARRTRTVASESAARGLDAAMTEAEAGFSLPFEDDFGF